MWKSGIHRRRIDLSNAFAVRAMSAALPLRTNIVWFVSALWTARRANTLRRATAARHSAAVQTAKTLADTAFRQDMEGGMAAHAAAMTA